MNLPFYRFGILLLHALIAATIAAGCNSAEQASDGGSCPDAGAIVPQAFLPPPPEGKKWELVWSDEFNGCAIDEEKWVIEGGTEMNPSPRRGGYWVREAMNLDGAGHLVISTYKKGDRYYDGSMTTREFTKAYGYFEARMDVCKQEGHWPAFWMMGGEFGGTDARKGEEIDIMEKPWPNGDKAEFTSHALHWRYGGGELSYLSTTRGIMKGFHTFGLWWDKDMYHFYIDGREVWTTDVGGICEVPLPITLSDEVDNGTWAFGGDITKAILPDRTLVDYVRVYDLVDK